MIFALFLTHAYGAETNTTWTYADGGADWGTAYPECASNDSIESPIDFSFNWTSPDSDLHDWSEDGFFYLPDTAGAVKVGVYGFDNWVYQMRNFTGGAGGFYAAEPRKGPQNRQIYWQIDNIRFHVPAEHKINGTQYDVEMQIFGWDAYNRSVTCEGQGATSVFFKVDPNNTDTGNDFFNWQSDAKTPGNEVQIDLSLVQPKTLSTTDNIYGYDGTDTMPGCGNVCWYVVESPQGISQGQVDFFKLILGEYRYESNARDTGLGSDAQTPMFFWYGPFAPVPHPRPDPPSPDPPTADPPTADLPAPPSGTEASTEF